MLEFIRGTSTDYLNQSCSSLWLWVVGCGLWDADGDGMCVGDGSVMDVRIKTERERESIFISISHVQKNCTWDMETPGLLSTSI